MYKLLNYSEGETGTELVRLHVHIGLRIVHTQCKLAVSLALEFSHHGDVLGRPGPHSIHILAKDRGIRTGLHIPCKLVSFQ